MLLTFHLIWSHLAWKKVMEAESLKRIAEAVYYPGKIKGKISVQNDIVFIFWDGGGETRYDPENNPGQLLDILTLLIDKDLSLEKGFCSRYEYFIVDEAQINYKGHTITEVILNAAEEIIK